MTTRKESSLRDSAQTLKRTMTTPTTTTTRRRRRKRQRPPLLRLGCEQKQTLQDAACALHPFGTALGSSWKNSRAEAAAAATAAADGEPDREIIG
jgi:hypothetical protein